MQRIRLTFSRGQEIKYISHLDLLRMWERIFRRAKVSLAYTKGFNPHPRMALAAPLPVGMLASTEMIEFYVETPTPLAELEKAIQQQLPLGVLVSHLEEVEVSAPSLPATVRAAEYEVAIADALPRSEVEERIGRLLQATELPRERRHKKEIRRYDLRPLIAALFIERWNSERVIGMRLLAESGATGRPEEVLDELGLMPSVIDITRSKLLLAG